MWRVAERNKAGKVTKLEGSARGKFEDSCPALTPADEPVNAEDLFHTREHLGKFKVPLAAGDGVPTRYADGTE